MTRLATIAAIAAASAAVILTPVAAHAQEPSPPEQIPAKARSLAERGRALHESGDYANAIAAFKEAYVMAPSPGLLFNIAQAYRLQGNCDDAALMYRRYIDTGPTPEGRALAEAHLVNVERCMHKISLHITGAGGPDAPGAQVPATETQLTATAAGGSRARLEKTIGVGVAVAGGLALSVALYYAYEAHSISNAVEDAYANGGKGKDVAPLDREGQRDSTFAKIFGIGGAAAAITGTVLYTLGRRTERANQLAIMPSRHGAEVSLSWAF